MKASELMLGDLVLLYGEPIRVTATLLNMMSIDESNAVQPIPITEETLKVNGFDIIQDGDSLTIWKQKDDEYGNEVYDITIYGSKDVMRFDTSIRFHGAIRKNIKFVHELQHALRLCGLNELADDFKIK